eukprot:TRINITY_DN498_c0_g1_i2.p1 TRINITY_DN498_c0_g1~~TRINITY_DN498_c0_g1_i2.p1  ORF type:complete len:444 (+),score=98.27 TRINITY_DN498_c0_g1_i2:95-1426(+)
MSQQVEPLQKASPQVSPKSLPSRMTLPSITSSIPTSVSSPVIVLSAGAFPVTAVDPSTGSSFGQSAIPLDGIILSGGSDCKDSSSADLSEAELGTGAWTELPGTRKTVYSPQSVGSPVKRRPTTADPESTAAQRRDSLGPNAIRVSIGDLLKWQLEDSPGGDGALVKALCKEDMREAAPPALFGGEGSADEDAKEDPATIPRLSRIVRIGSKNIHCAYDVDDWLAANTRRPRSDVVVLQYAPPEKSLELLLRDGRELHKGWKSRMDWVRGMWCDKSGKRLYEVEGFSVAVRCDVLTDTLGEDCGARKMIIPFNDQIWLEDLWLNMSDSTKTVLKWQRSGGRTQVWRRPKESDVCLRRWKKHIKQQADPDPAATPGQQPLDSPTKVAPLPPEVQARAASACGTGQQMERAQPLAGPRASQGRFARILRGLCCGSAADVAQDCRR